MIREKIKHDGERTSREYTSLRFMMLIMLLVALGIAISLFLIFNFIGEKYIEINYLSEEKKIERENEYKNDLQEYVTEQGLGCDDAQKISEWAKKNKYLYVLVYKGDDLLFESGHEEVKTEGNTPEMGENKENADDVQDNSVENSGSSNSDNDSSTSENRDGNKKNNTGITVKEMPPQEYAKFHNITEEDKKESTNLIHLLVKAPKAFWQIGLVQFFCWFAFLYMWTYTTAAVAGNVWGTTETTSEGYQIAGNWVGVLFAVQSIGSVLWAMILPMFRKIKVAYSASLVLGAIGFVSTFFIHDQYLLFISFILIGCGWAAMLAMPFAMLTNSLSGSSMGAYLGLFNCTICLPQIIAALLGGVILSMVGGNQAMMLVVAGVALLLGAVAVFFIKEKTK